MNDSLMCILIKAKELNKWMPVKYLVKYHLDEIDLLQLEDDGFLLIHRRSSVGLLLKLTIKGYHFFNQ